MRGEVTARVRERRPPAQTLSQGVQLDQAPTWQSSGQAWVLQALSSESLGGQAAPPWRGAWRVRVRMWRPEPQDLEQWPQAFQVPTSQSIGHEWVLQSW